MIRLLLRSIPSGEDIAVCLDGGEATVQEHYDLDFSLMAHKVMVEIVIMNTCGLVAVAGPVM